VTPPRFLGLLLMNVDGVVPLLRDEMAEDVATERLLLLLRLEGDGDCLYEYPYECPYRGDVPEEEGVRE